MWCARSPTAENSVLMADLMADLMAAENSVLMLMLINHDLSRSPSLSLQLPGCD